MCMDGSALKKKARDVMTKRVVAATRQYGARDLAVLLQSGTFSGVPIVDPGSLLVGMVTEFDLLKAVADKKDLHHVTAGDIMSTLPICVEEHDTIEKVIQIMIEHKIIRLPVVRDGKLIGLISRTDILDQVVDLHLLNVYGA